MSILIILQVLQGLALAGYGVYRMIIDGWPGVALFPEPATSFSWALAETTSGFAQVLYSIPILLVAFAILRGFPWAWLAAMALQGLGLVIALFAYAMGRPNYVAMLLGTLLVFYMNQHEIQTAFREPRSEG